MSFPAACEREIGARDFFRHHPKREDVAGVWTKAVAAVFFRNDRGKQACTKQVFKILERKTRGAIVFSRAPGEVLLREHTDTIDQLLLLDTGIDSKHRYCSTCCRAAPRGRTFVAFSQGFQTGAATEGRLYRTISLA